MNDPARARMPVAILLMGPTASGKSAVAIEIAAHFPVEIVSVDSAQVFRGMDVGTAKPAPAERARVPHHLIDILDPDQSYSAAQFRSDAARLMLEITERERVPLLVGGTMLYFKALREGLADLPPADPQLRAAIDADAKCRGWPALHAELAQLDPASAARLAPTDAQRIQRALEVVRLMGEPLAAFFARQTPQAPPYRLLPVALLASDRAVLHRRIARRFDEMLAAGFVAEVEMLRARYRLDAELPSMRCVGYRQIWDMLAGRLPAAELRDRGIFATRQFAKRQITWLTAWQKAPHALAVIDPLAPGHTALAAAMVAEHIAGGGDLG